MHLYTSEAQVLEQTKSPQHLIQAYHLDRSLLFQFILAEMIKAHQEAALLSWRKKKLTPSDIQLLIHPIIRLCGIQQEYMRIFAWNSSEGILAKLKKYCAYFAEMGPSGNKQLTTLQRLASSAWLTGMQCADHLRQLKEKEKYSESETTQLSKNLTRLKTTIHKLGKETIRAIREFNQNENVIFYILRHAEQFDIAFGSGFVKKLIEDLYSEGLSEALQLLKNRYTLRGFDHLIPHISNCITAL